MNLSANQTGGIHHDAVMYVYVFLQSPSDNGKCVWSTSSTSSRSFPHRYMQTSEGGVPDICEHVLNAENMVWIGMVYCNEFQKCKSKMMLSMSLLLRVALAQLASNFMRIHAVGQTKKTRGQNNYVQWKFGLGKGFETFEIYLTRPFLKCQCLVPLCATELWHVQTQLRLRASRTFRRPYLSDSSIFRLRYNPL